ncbi:Ig-like domain-containing protein [Thermospira aquatica]|uniref:FlgD Ig-like domain-containing protein n=1 Tax=Thermospira aquatica TaxID=2828656 RepID=A0AAX3BDR6_9SPIR|nr:Ig-like domain-containing protein [Thermospira aquatica]URA10293.1 hypothetical protein KDW03_00365 [Thermospira aquatica]
MNLKKYFFLSTFLVTLSCTTTIEDGIILSPRDGETVRGVVIISLSPPPGIVVDRVEVFIQNVLFKTINAPGPYTCEWDTTTGEYPNGFYQITASVYDIDGQVTTQTIEVQVAN